MKRYALLFVILLLAAAVVADEPTNETPQYVKVTDVKWRHQPFDGSYHWVNLTGKIKNVSDHSFSGVLLQWSIFDKNGVKISIIQEAGILNLKPGDVAEWSAAPPICAYCYKGVVPYTYRLDKIQYAYEK